jgi:ketosteroid isomerase-like protein
MPDTAQLEAYVAISQVKATCCRMLDTKDWDGYADLFTEDMELDMRPSGGTLIKGRDAMIRMISGALAGQVTVHQVHSPEMTIVGNVAEVIWAMQDRVVWTEDRKLQIGNAGHTGFGHYHERYVRGPDGRWRITYLKLTRLHIDIDR